MTYLDKLNKRFEKDFFATKATKIKLVNAEPVDLYNETNCEATNVICEMVIEDLHRNAAGGVMGGAIFTLADYAFAICANALPPRQSAICITS
jgi:acyl-CoA thioesterase